MVICADSTPRTEQHTTPHYQSNNASITKACSTHSAAEARYLAALCSESRLLVARARSMGTSRVQLLKEPSAAAMHALAKTPVSIEGAAMRPLRKTAQRVSSPDLEDKVVQWIGACEILKLPVVARATIRAKAKKVRVSMMRAAT